jgi:hypothetical protein
MAIKRVRIDPAKLGISATPEIDRRKLLEESHWSAQSKVDAVRSAGLNQGHGALQIREKLQNRGLYLSMNDLMGMPSRGPTLDRADVFQGMETGMEQSGMLTEDFPTQHDNIIMEDLYAQPQRQQRPQPRALPPQQRQQQPQQQPQRQALRETIMGGTRETVMRQPPAAVQPPWRVKAYLGETRGGNQIPIWKVANAKTGSEIDKMFRIESIAARVAGLLNESGDINDPRALSLISVYDKRDRLLKEARLLEKTADGKPMKTERLNAIRAEINQLDYRLGI